MMLLAPPRQFVHRAINDACEKEGLHYDDYAKLLSLAEYSQLKHTLSSLIRPLSRDGIAKEEVSSQSVGDEIGWVGVVR